MPYEKGERTDELGNEYEKNWILYNLLKVIQEKPSYVIIEPLGDEDDYSTLVDHSFRLG